MANIQKYFEQYHQNIRTDYSINSELAEKRDIVLGKIENFLKEKNLPHFERLLQGSYKMKTGVKPIDGLSYDIDIGLCFSISESDYSVTEVRKWIMEAIKGHTSDVKERGPCIRVTYSKGFNLDLVIYAKYPDVVGKTVFRLGHKTRGWIEADPPGLLSHFNIAVKRFEGSEDVATQTVQIRRLIRALKRWSDERFKDDPALKPAGIAFTLHAINSLSSPCFLLDGESDDSKALRTIINAVPSLGRLVVKKPTPEYEDVFGKLSEVAMDEFKQKLFTLRDALVEAEKTADPKKACLMIQEHLGTDFPVPASEDVASKTTGPAIITSSAGA